MKLTKNWGAIPNHPKKEEENYLMNVKTTIKVLNKKSNPFTTKDGQDRVNFRLTYSQDNDDIVGEANVREEVYAAVEKGCVYELLGNYLTTRNGKYVVWVSAKPVSNNDKAVL